MEGKKQEEEKKNDSEAEGKKQEEENNENKTEGRKEEEEKKNESKTEKQESDDKSKDLAGKQKTEEDTKKADDKEKGSGKDAKTTEGQLCHFIFIQEKSCLLNLSTFSQKYSAFCLIKMHFSALIWQMIDSCLHNLMQGRTQPET